MLKLTVCVIALAAAFSARLPLAAQAPEGDAAKGKQLFVRDGCYQCHGYQAQGGSAGARLAPHPLPLKALIAYVRHPSGQMPPVTAKVVTDAELGDIYAFLKTIPDPKPVKDISLLNQ
jgi:mono/diheme cytochrome c family protein